MRMAHPRGGGGGGGEGEGGGVKDNFRWGTKPISGWVGGRGGTAPLCVLIKLLLLGE